MTRGRLGAYLRWQAIDFFKERGIAIAIIGIVIGAEFVVGIRHMAPLVTDETFRRGMFAQLLSSLISPLTPLFALLAINRIVSKDRTSGYYRFLFSKPISIRRYYAQAFGVNAIGLMIVIGVLAGIARLCGAPLPLVPLILIFGIAYIAIGGIGFLCSVVTRFDWQALIAVWFGSYLLYMLYGNDGGIPEVLVHVLPPAHLSNDVYQGLLGIAPVPWHPLMWLLAYGIVCFAAGVLLLRYRPFAAS
jgi:ABC-type transport system involved in multi-copper enzyme maturation permease subunit